MSNLKKVLSLSVVFIMVFALMATAGAAFGDADDIEFVDEANLLSSLEIIKGDLSGNFLPQADVYRNQMAKMIYVALNKGIDNGAPLYASLDVPLKDIDNDWAKNYIKFVYNLGIISGSPTGYFFGSNKVTGFEAAKMMLTMLGYKADVEGYVGANWAFNVARDAMLAGILDGLEDIDLGKNLTKEEAAKMIYNTIFTEMVKYVDGVAEGTGKDFAEAKLALETKTAILIATEVAGLDTVASKGKIKIAEYDASNDLQDAYEVTGSASIEDLGKEVTLYVRMKGSNIEKVYGSAVATSKNKVQVLYNVADSIGTAANYSSNVFGTVSLANAKYFKNFDAGASDGSDTAVVGDKIIAIDNGGKAGIDVVLLTKYSFGEVDVKATSTGNRVSVGTTTNMKPAEIYGFDGIAKGDYAILAANNAANATYKYFIEKASSVVGAITESKNGQFLIGSKWYGVSAIDGKATFTFTTIGNKDATFYLDASGRLVYYVLDSTEAPVDYAYGFVSSAQNKENPSDEFSNDGKDPMVVIYTLDGKKIYEVASAKAADDSKIELTAIRTGVEGELVTYTLDDAGKVSIKVVGEDEAATAVNYVKGASLIEIDSSNYVINDDTVIFFYNADSDGDPEPAPTYTVKKDKSILPAITAGSGLIDSSDIIYVADANGILKAIYFGFDKTAPVAPGAVDGTYAIITDFTMKLNANNKVYYEVSIFNGKDEVKTLETGADPASSITNNIAKGNYINYKTTDGKISEITKYTLDNIEDYSTDGAYVGYVKAISGSTVLLTNGTDSASNWFSIKSGTVVGNIDLDAGEYTPNTTLAADYLYNDEADTGSTVVIIKDGVIVSIFQRTDDFYTIS